MDRDPIPMNGGEQASFKETLILNLKRNKEVCLNNVEVFKQKAEMCDEIVALLETEEAASKFAEQMQKLQEGVPQG